VAYVGHGQNEDSEFDRFLKFYDEYKKRVKL
jgi:hypothetical protein